MSGLAAFSPDQVAAVIVTYGDRSLFVRQVIEGILAGTVRPGHLVLVENDSIARSPLLGPEGWMSVLRMPNNVGSSGGYHGGIQQALELGADLVWCLDDDNLPEPGCLAQLLDHTDPSIDRIVVANRPQRPEFDKRRIKYALRLANNSFMGFSIVPAPASPDTVVEGPLRETIFFGYGGALVPRRAIEACGLPDPKLFLYQDDSEWAWRLRKSGWKAYMLHGAVIRDLDLPWGGFHPNGASPLFSCTVPEQKLWYCIRNRAYLERKMGFNGRVHRLNFLLWLIALEIKTLIAERNPAHSLRTFKFALAAFQQGSQGIIGRFEDAIAATPPPCAKAVSQRPTM